MTRRWHIKDILVGFLAMILSLIVLAVILVTRLAISRREIPIGPAYSLIPIGTFVLGLFWSMRRSSRPKPPAKPPSYVTIIVKSTVTGVTAMILSVIAYVIWIWLRIPRSPGTFVSIDIRLLLYWPVLLGGFLAGFIPEYRHASNRRSMLAGGDGGNRKE
jgi:hypothetical protein